MIAITDGQLSIAEELELFIRVRFGRESEESLMEEYGISSSKIRKIEQMSLEGALEALNQIKTENRCLAAEDTYSREVVSCSE